MQQPICFCPSCGADIRRDPTGGHCSTCAVGYSEAVLRVLSGAYETEGAHDAYVVYARRDIQEAAELADALTAAGISCYVPTFNGYREEVPAEYLRERLEAIGGCRAVVFVSSAYARGGRDDVVKYALGYVCAQDAKHAPRCIKFSKEPIIKYLKKPRVEYRIETAADVADAAAEAAAEAAAPAARELIHFGNVASETFCHGCESAQTPAGVAECLRTQLTDPPRVMPDLLAPTYEVGSTVFFGFYPQENGLEPIEWLVLAREEERALVISRYVLDVHAYDSSCRDVTWEECSLRAWLREVFLPFAFTPEERTRIHLSVNKNAGIPSREIPDQNDTRDKVFCLSIEEAEMYFESDSARSARPTIYAWARNATSSMPKNAAQWWLRSHGQSAWYGTTVWSSGNISLKLHFTHPTVNQIGVRPAMWLRCEPSGREG